MPDPPDTLPAIATRSCPGPICHGAARGVIHFRSRAKLCRLCEERLRLARQLQRGHRRRGIPVLCECCGLPEGTLTDDGTARPLIGYYSAGQARVVGYVCSTCERLVVDANHSIWRLAQAIAFLAAPSRALVVDAVTS